MSPLSLRNDLTPDMAQTALKMADLDPLAAFRYITPAAVWGAIDAYAAEIARSLPPQYATRGGVLAALKADLQEILAAAFPQMPALVPAGASVPPPVPSRSPAPLPAAEAPEPGPEEAAPGDAPAAARVNALEYLSIRAGNAKKSAARFLGLE